MGLEAPAMHVKLARLGSQCRGYTVSESGHFVAPTVWPNIFCAGWFRALARWRILII
jgi:hypothetical protein